MLWSCPARPIQRNCRLDPQKQRRQGKILRRSPYSILTRIGCYSFVLGEAGMDRGTTGPPLGNYNVVGSEGRTGRSPFCQFHLRILGRCYGQQNAPGPKDINDGGLSSLFTSFYVRHPFTKAKVLKPSDNASRTHVEVHQCVQYNDHLDSRVKMHAKMIAVVGVRIVTDSGMDILTPPQKLGHELKQNL